MGKYWGLFDVQGGQGVWVCVVEGVCVCVCMCTEHGGPARLVPSPPSCVPFILFRPFRFITR